MSRKEIGSMRRHRLELPRRFFEDHEERELPSGEVAKRKSKTVVVDLNDEELDEVDSDARYYADSSYGDMDPEYWGLVLSARATTKKINAYRQMFAITHSGEVNTSAYSHEDFQQNPGKYSLFRTARIAQEIPSSPEFAVGQVVNIRYFTTQINKVRNNVEMPVYEVWVGAADCLKTSPSMLYASALKDFCL